MRCCEQLAERVSARVLHASRDSLTQTRRELDEYFGGSRQAFERPARLAPHERLPPRGAARDRRDPLRQTASYRDVATRAGSPSAVRAAGSALATNPLPIVVPCHRVLRTGGGLGGYAGGLDGQGRAAASGGCGMSRWCGGCPARRRTRPRADQPDASRRSRLSRQPGQPRPCESRAAWSSWSRCSSTTRVAGALGDEVDADDGHAVDVREMGVCGHPIPRVDEPARRVDLEVFAGDRADAVLPCIERR